MGIYDRDYYRDNKVSFLGSFADRGLMCKWLIGINVVAFVVQLITKATPEMFENLFSLQVDAVLHGQVWRLITYSLLALHGHPVPHPVQHAVPVVVWQRRRGPVRAARVSRVLPHLGRPGRRGVRADQLDAGYLESPIRCDSAPREQ